jgi:hypothetical protein
VPPYEFTVAGWPGTREQAARLDAEARDPEWAPSMEQLLTDGLNGLADVVYQNLTIACRTTLCGIAFEFSIADPRGERYTETRQIRERFVGAVKDATERIGNDGLSYDFTAAYDVNGAWAGRVGITVRRRAPTSADLLLALPASGDEPE